MAIFKGGIVGGRPLKNGAKPPKSHKTSKIKYRHTVEKALEEKPVEPVEPVVDTADKTEEPETFVVEQDENLLIIEPIEEEPEVLPDNVCEICGYVAKNSRGLSAHKRKHK